MLRKHTETNRQSKIETNTNFNLITKSTIVHIWQNMPTQ